MTKTLYDPEVEKRGIQQGITQRNIEIAINLLDILEDEIISQKTDLSIEEGRKLRAQYGK